VSSPDLLLVLGDQLERNSPLLASADPRHAIILMAEVHDESTHVPSHKARTALFVSAMRHCRDDFRAAGWTVDYRPLSSTSSTLAGELRQAIARHAPSHVRIVHPGDHRVLTALLQACPELEVLPDTHFLCSLDDFRRHASSRKQLRMEFFYREMRRRYDVLMDKGQPTGGAWNFDAANRQAFDARGPSVLPPPLAFSPDDVTTQVIGEVQRAFPANPGSLDHFDWPVTPAQAELALQDFLDHRLPQFGRYQDAMWTGQPWLYHSRLSAALNLKLLHPLRVIQQAEARYRRGHAPLAAVEGFIRQILGWREYVRGIYWLHMPAYAESNALAASRPLPAFYWTAQTDMRCLHAAIAQTLEFGYAHHIQRLMVTGLFSLLLGVEPRQVHEWYLAMYVDAVEWVELPNSLGMSQYADGGLMASKPYIASGRYIQRMSDYCQACRYNPAESTGPTACPFTTLYWDFLFRHHDLLRRNPRMLPQLRNAGRFAAETRSAIQSQAETLRNSL